MGDAGMSRLQIAKLGGKLAWSDRVFVDRVEGQVWTHTQFWPLTFLASPPCVPSNNHSDPQSPPPEIGNNAHLLGGGESPVG